jgi:hypothetical protein
MANSLVMRVFGVTAGTKQRMDRKSFGSRWSNPPNRLRSREKKDSAVGPFSDCFSGRDTPNYQRQKTSCVAGKISANSFV